MRSTVTARTAIRLILGCRGVGTLCSSSPSAPFPAIAHTWPGFSGAHQARRQHAVSRQRVCMGSGCVGPAAVPCLPLTAALLSRLSVTTSRLHSCGLGLLWAVLCVGYGLGLNSRNAPRGSPVRMGCRGCVRALASCLPLVSSFRFLFRALGGGPTTSPTSYPPQDRQQVLW